MKKLKTLLIWISCIVIFCVAYSMMSGTRAKPLQDFASFMAEVEGGEISEVRIDGNEIAVTRLDGGEYTTYGLADDELIRALSEQGVLMSWGEAERPLQKLLVMVLPLLLLVILFLYFLRKAGGGTANILSLRKTTARVISDARRVSFEDVGGCDEAKEQLRDVIEFLKHPKRWTAAGVRLPRGTLLEGPPGCGKTLLARAVAGETDAKFFLVCASEFIEMFVGVGAARVRDTFDTATKQAPAVIFIDELDAVGRRRGSGVGSSHDEREQTLNQILACMDGFEQSQRVVVIAATNRAEVLDSALMRPGRFDRRVEIPPLSREQRVEVLRIHTRGKPLADDVSLEELSGRAANMNGAALENLANEAGLLAVRRASRGRDEPIALRRQDFLEVLERNAPRGKRFDCVDALLLESTTQLAQPTGKARVRLTLVDGISVEGELLWADATFIKVRGDIDGEGVVVSKWQIKTVEALEGTDLVDIGDLAPDPWAGRTPDLV